ncbi:sigma-70 family RNA polymerase sigma factor [Streptomyces clavuligerus]|uniref:RNA polymerase sigma factor n=2 Tax=Streptomyces clavuligerus TaxID=1901 RepID=B5H2I7_STRCL|nr:sigma-70 family RNA polymerase sigma factor [Streptomyces clavuligerus]ANW21576.1 RNA polymerase subunit sigma [Streptomyces clavuligerus]AXU16204.1 sigma-70 family RNA polymerase sigma factor [Streptomyces clavuligerus]EDY52783.1 RNA polymerase sigma factor SigL [Streptomyces clavuligerus]EFG05255.1 RNA polymerase sigma factor [Streptomyces clavuligerus]MBY6306357.1 sigma-70 family RNA polymerase sigma factor [Streptomyces clavuligerus]
MTAPAPGKAAPHAPARATEEELAQLQREHGRAVFGFLLGLTYGDTQRAEDLLQETMIRAWRHPEALHTRHESMRPWLFTVARRLAIDARRARLSRAREAVHGTENTLIPADDPIEPSIQALDIRAALARLTDDHRAVLQQVYFRGLSVNEAAAALGIPPGTVKSRTYYALRSLRGVLRAYGTLD